MSWCRVVSEESGFYGGAIDSVIQRLIEILAPSESAVDGLARPAHDWTVLQVYFAIT